MEGNDGIRSFVKTLRSKILKGKTLSKTLYNQTVLKKYLEQKNIANIRIKSSVQTLRNKFRKKNLSKTL
jgi:predicted DNA-binding protein (UPF0278 family)